MPTLKEFNAKLGQLRNTRKVTKTMKMVSANKWRKAQEAQRRVREYQEGVQRVALRVAGSRAATGHPLLESRAPVRAVLCLLVTSDRGLCGGFNSGLNRKVAGWIREQEGRGVGVQMSFCGRRGLLHFRDTAAVRMSYEGLSARPSFGDALRLAHELRASFLAGRFDEVHVACNTVGAGGSQAAIIERLLPLSLDGPGAGPEADSPWIVEPSPDALADLVLRQTVALRLHGWLLGSSVAEHRARMSAMENSTANADRMIEAYTLLRNRARQASITRELSEIVAGAEALK